MIYMHDVDGGKVTPDNTANDAQQQIFCNSLIAESSECIYITPS